MRNRAEKDAVRSCHLTHASVHTHSHEPKTRVAEVYPYFDSKRFINHSIRAAKRAQHTLLCATMQKLG